MRQRRPGFRRAPSGLRSLRLLAGKIPVLQKYAHQKNLEDIETELAIHFGGFLSAEEKETLALCRQLRNKVLHTDFCAARSKLNELGIETASERY